MVLSKLKPGIIYDIPYRTLCHPDFPNMLVVGRAISCSGDAWEATRVIPPAVITGQAAGTAAAIALSKNVSVAEISIDSLQRQLRKDDVIISQADV